MNPLRKAFYIARYFGPGFILRRADLRLRHYLGQTRRVFRDRPWHAVDLGELCVPGVPTAPVDYAAWKSARRVPFFFSLQGAGVDASLGEAWQGAPDLGAAIDPRAWRRSALLRRPGLFDRANLLEHMRGVYFFDRASPEPIDWYRDPFSGAKADGASPWCDISDFDPEAGDIRCLWEPARAAWAMDLARAAAWGWKPSSAATAGEIYWRWVESWMDACPPYRGIHWKCGQEASVRLLALAFGFQAFADDPSTTPVRIERFARLAFATGYRVFHHLSYAVSQRNNHALSEAMGLMLVAHLFPEFRASRRWNAAGRRVFARQLRAQIYSDGSYVQHSFNYQRVMLDVSIIALRLGELSGEPFEAELYELLHRSSAFMRQMMDGAGGRLPNVGHDDSAWVLPLCECDARDFRPAIQSVHWLCAKQQAFEPGPWDENLFWLFGGREAVAWPTAWPEAPRSDREPNAASAPQCGPETASLSSAPWVSMFGLESADAISPAGVDGARGSLVPGGVSARFDAGGYYTLRQSQSWALMRCPRYRHRPSQMDTLHVDLWRGGINVLRDAGTFRYYVPGRPDVEEYFSGPASHNVAVVDGRYDSQRVSRFLWLPWPSAALISHGGTMDRPGLGGAPRSGVAPRPDSKLGDSGSPECGGATNRASATDSTGAVNSDGATQAAPAIWCEGVWDRFVSRGQSVRQRRTLVGLPYDTWLIVDDWLEARARRGPRSQRKGVEVTSWWHLCDGAWRSIGAHAFACDVGALGQGLGIAAVQADEAAIASRLVSGRDDPGRVQGWTAPCYGRREAIPTVECVASGPMPMRVLTVVGDAGLSLTLERRFAAGEAWRVQGRFGVLIVDLEMPGGNGLQTFRSVREERSI